MLRDEEDAILSLGGFALEGLLTDLDPDAVSGLRAQLGLSQADIGYGREDLYNGKFADDDNARPAARNAERAQEGSASATGRDWEDEVDQEFQEERNSLSFSTRANRVGKVRGEMDDYDEDEDADEDESLAADSPQVYRPKKHSRHLALAQNRYASSTPAPSSPCRTASSPLPELGKAQPEHVDVHELYPTFIEGGVLQFTDLFASLPRKRQKISGGYVNIQFPDRISTSLSTTQLLENPDLRLQRSSSRDAKLPQLLEESYRELIATLPPVQEPSLEPQETQEEIIEEAHLDDLVAEQLARGATPWKLPTDERGWDALAMQDWEDDIIWKPSQSHGLLSQPIDTLTRLTRPRNSQVDQGDWVQSIIYDAKGRPWKDFTALHIVEEDAKMLRNTNEQADDIEKELAKNTLPAVNPRPTVWSRDTKQQGLDPFNLSNDRLYEVSKEHRRRVRQTFGNLEVQHSYPALKLQLPLYKTRLTKHEARSFHRPALQFPVNIPIKFSKVKAAKKKKDKSGRKIRNTAPASQLLRNTADLTLKDTSGFMLFEFSEEAPPVISNIGMGGILVNYYRKTDEFDEHVPKDDIGEPFVLDVADESPFMKFGSIQPGETVPTLYNNLVRAPLFKHTPGSTDFLVIRSTTATETCYYIRSIENLYVVGQTYPVTEVPGPHSRKVTTQLKLRLQSITSRLCTKSDGGSIKISTVMKYFNDQTEMQMRQRLKEFMEYKRKGPYSGHWTIRSEAKIPEKEEFFKLVTPEAVCLAESMQVGQRQLLDAGYGKDANAEGDGDDQSKLDIEQQLAPWSTTRNFALATQNKAMLRLYGEGDPSGRGEAFSFIRVSMKDVFLRDGETLEERQAAVAARARPTHRQAEQQDIYKQEIERIWQSQRFALSDPNPPELTQEDELRARGSRLPVGNTPGNTADTPLPPYSAGIGTPGDWSMSRRSRSPSAFSRQSSPERDDGMSMGSRNNVVGANKALKIRRLIDGKWQTEVVRDPTVVNAYLRQRRLIDEQESSTEALMPSDDPEKNRLARKRIEEAIAKLKRNQERRLARKSAKENGMLFSKKSMMINKTESTMTASTPPSSSSQIRKCGNCGQVGHMKTNRKCPRWADFNATLAGIYGPGPLSAGGTSMMPMGSVAGTSEHGGSVAGTPNPGAYGPMEE